MKGVLICVNKKSCCFNVKTIQLFIQKNVPLCAFYNDTILSTIAFSNLQPIPIFVNYSFNNIPKQVGCRDGFEDIQDSFSFCINIDNSEYSLSRSEILLLNNTNIKNEIEIFKIEEISNKVVNLLYYFFEEFDLKLNSVRLSFSKADDNIILYLRLKDNSFSLNDLNTGKKIHLDELSEIVV